MMMMMMMDSGVQPGTYKITLGKSLLRPPISATPSAHHVLLEYNHRSELISSCKSGELHKTSNGKFTALFTSQSGGPPQKYTNAETITGGADYIAIFDPITHSYILERLDSTTSFTQQRPLKNNKPIIQQQLLTSPSGPPSNRHTFHNKASPSAASSPIIPPSESNPTSPLLPSIELTQPPPPTLLASEAQQSPVLPLTPGIGTEVEPMSMEVEDTAFDDLFDEAMATEDWRDDETSSAPTLLEVPATSTTIGTKSVARPSTPVISAASSGKKGLFGANVIDTDSSSSGEEEDSDDE